METAQSEDAESNVVGHLQRSHAGYIKSKMVTVELPGKTKRERPKRRLVDVKRA